MGQSDRGAPTGLVLVTALGLLLVASAAAATDSPEVAVSANRVMPERLEVHVGETVTWRSSGGQIFSLELDRHPRAHEVVIRRGVVRAYFRCPGEHWYTATLRDDGMRRLRGYVIVREAVGRPPDALTCGPQSSDQICLEP